MKYYRINFKVNSVKNGSWEINETGLANIRKKVIVIILFSTMVYVWENV